MNASSPLGQPSHPDVCTPKFLCEIQIGKPRVCSHRSLVRNWNRWAKDRSRWRPENDPQVTSTNAHRLSLAQVKECEVELQPPTQQRSEFDRALHWQGLGKPRHSSSRVGTPSNGASSEDNWARYFCTRSTKERAMSWAKNMRKQSRKYK